MSREQHSTAWPDEAAPLLINRIEELSALKKALLVDRLTKISVVGMGGIGKTTLLTVLTREVRGDYQAIFGFSGYELDPNAFETKLDSLRSEAQQISGRKLLIIDGAEVVSTNRLSEILRSRYFSEIDAQIVVASRAKVPQMDLEILLGPLQHSDIQLLIEANGVNLDASEWPKVLDVANGHPLAGALLSGLLASSKYSPDDISKYAGSFETSGILDPLGQPIPADAPASGSVVTSISFINDELLHVLAQEPSSVFQLSDRQFEELVAEIFSRQGYEVTLTPRSNDGGKDLYVASNSTLGSFLFLVECKKYSPSRPVGVELVRHLYGVVEAERATAGILATTSRFTKGAREFQEQFRTRLSLKDYIQLQKLIRSVTTRGAGAETEPALVSAEGLVS